MRHILTVAFAGAVLALVAGCGGVGGLFSSGLHGAIATSIEDDCVAHHAGITANHSTEATAERSALIQCRSAGGSQCEINANFGSAYQGSNECAALVYGGYATGCFLKPGLGGTLSAAEAHALSRCRSEGYGCRLVTAEGGERFATCSE